MRKTVLLVVLIPVLFVLIGCGAGQNNDRVEAGNVGMFADEYPVLEGLRLTTELEYYAEGTVRVLGIWENNSDIDIIFGESWQLERFDTDRNEWIIVWEDNINVGFYSVGYLLPQGMSRKHTYRLSIYDDNIQEGRYRIRTDFNDFNTDGLEFDTYSAFAEFTVTRDETLHRRSELDFDDFHNSREIRIDYASFDSTNPLEAGFALPVRVYKNVHTFDTTIVINGEDYYSIAEGTGPWGVLRAIYFSMDDGKYLIYSYSREDENEEKLSYVGVFDLIKREIIFLSEAFKEYDISISDRDEDYFNVSFIGYDENEHGGFSSWSVKELGTLQYIDGVFSLNVAND